MDIFGMGKAASTAIVVALAVASAGGAAWYVIDAIGDARESTLRKDALEDRLKGIRDANVRGRQIRGLPRNAKIRCNAEGPGTECCRADAVGVPRCVAPVAGGQ